MGKIAFVFAGQGAQYSGMGLDYYERNEVAKMVFDCAEKERSQTLYQCFHGSEAVLQETKITQPCMFTFEIAVAQALIAKGIVPDVVAGFSLGELAALQIAGVADFQKMFSLVCLRGALMQEATEKNLATMVAVLKISNELVVEQCKTMDGVYPVNFNCPGNVSVAVRNDVMSVFKERIKGVGGRVVPLKVAGGFHSPFMEEPARKFAMALNEVEMRSLKIPVIANLTGEFYGDDIASTLAAQMKSPVRWEESVHAMIASGVDCFIEIGPGDQLGGMIKRIDATVERYSTGSYEAFERLLSKVIKNE